MSLDAPRLRVLAVTTALAAALLAPSAQPSASAAPTSPAPASPAPAAAPTPRTVAAEDSVGSLVVENSFVSSVGWVKPGDTYPSRILLANTGDVAVPDATVRVAAPTGTRFVSANRGAVVSDDGTSVTWSPGPVASKATETLVMQSRAATTDELPTVVWRDLSSTATVTVGAASAEVTSHGPKVIPPAGGFDTARYGDRPFPVVPVRYTDRAYQAHDRTLDTVINDPSYPGSTFNLFQEMSLGQLYPEGTVPSDGVQAADFASYEPGFDFSRAEAGQTCTGTTFADTPVEEEGTPLYPERISNGVYNLPGQTQYYGADSNGSALTGALAGVGALQAIDSGCGPTGKLVHDAAAIADPEIDYSDYDTDKDGVVDFFMTVFAGCGGNGSSQLSVAGCPYPDAPYDNVWPHSSSLEYYYTDPDTGLPGFTTDDQLHDLEGRPLWYTDDSYTEMTTTDTGDALTVFVRVGPYNVNPETAIDAASVISHEYGHSLGLPDFYSTGSRETYGDWNLMATDKSHNIDAFGRQELGWVVPEVLDASRTESGITDSKEDTDTITWQTQAGTPYTLTESTDGRVQNSQMYVAKLPGRILLDEAKFQSGDGATPVHTWWSRSGNDFGCAKDPGKGHNLDLALPEIADLPAGTTLSLDFKSMWDIEWDYDYGYLLTSVDGGRTFTSNESENGFTTQQAQNPNANACQAHYGNGLTGTSASYDAGTQDLDRVLGEYPEMTYQADRYDISELVGADLPVLRFSYATDPGLARPGWFIDDLTVTATLPDGSTRDIYVTDFETSGGPEDPRIFNGGCRADGPGGGCTQGWQYVAAGSEGPSDHAYYLEMRDRSGFDLDGKGQNDRDPIGFEAGFYNSYTDEAHGYGNAGTDDPPAQSPLDSQPQPGENAPDLNDAAWTAAAGDNAFSDSGAGHVDNYADPSSTDGTWHFDYDCLGYTVQSMTGDAEGPVTSDGDLTGAVSFTMGEGCAEYDYGYAEGPGGGSNTAPTAAASVTPQSTMTGRTVTFSAADSTDTETPGELDYSWDFGDGGTPKDATGQEVRHAYDRRGTYTAAVTVTDPQGATDTATVDVRVNGTSARAFVHCRSQRVDKAGGWRVVRDERARGDAYCDNRKRSQRADVTTFTFRGPWVSVVHGDARSGGRATVTIDGVRKGTLWFSGDRRRPSFGERKPYRDLGSGRHTIRIVMDSRVGFVEGFLVRR